MEQQQAEPQQTVDKKQKAASLIQQLGLPKKQKAAEVNQDIYTPESQPMSSESTDAQDMSKKEAEIDKGKSTWQQEQDAIDSDAALTPMQKQEKKVEVTAKALEGKDKNKLPLVRDIASTIIKEYEDANREIERLNNERKNLTKQQEEDIIKKTRYKKSEKYPNKYEYSTGASIIRKTKEQLIDDYYENKIKKIKKDEPRQGVLDIYRKQDREYSTPKSISEAYHKAKLDGSNPELVRAVEKLLNDNSTTNGT